MKVLLSGYYGFGNLGDEALLAGMLGGLTTGATVLSQNPKATRTLHSVAAAHRLTGLPQLLSHDALVSGGGGLLQDKTSARSLQYYLGVITLAKRLGKRVLVYGQSVGPLSAAGERAVAKTLRGLPVAVRDEPSQRLLDRLGVPSMLVADTALLLPQPATKPLEPHTPVLLIPRGGYPAVTDALAKLAQRLAREGVPLAGLALQPSEDSEALNYLTKAVPSLKKLEASTPHAALEQVAASRYVVSARLHGLIFAARAGRPFSGVAYDPKVEAFLAAMGRPAHPVTPDTDALYHELQTPNFDAAKATLLTARAEHGLTWLQRELAQTCRF